MTHDEWNWHERADELTAEAEIGLGWARAAMEWIATLAPAPVRQVLDVGAGPGVFTSELARCFADAAVVAVDPSEPLLERVLARAASAGVDARVTTVAGALDDALDELPDADVIWASRVLHHVPDQAATLRSLGARLRPGGVLALVEGGLPTRFLPAESGVGEPGLTERVDAAVAGEVHARLHHDHAAGAARPVLDWPAQLADAGLAPSGTRSFLLDLPAPVSEQVRGWLIARLVESRSWAGGALSAGDRDALDRLLDAEDPLGIARRPDLFLLTAVTVHTARRLGGTVHLDAQPDELNRPSIR